VHAAVLSLYPIWLNRPLTNPFLLVDRCHVVGVVDEVLLLETVKDEIRQNS
jgi:hypothetical protein